MKKSDSAVKQLNAEIAVLKKEVNSSKALVQRQLELAKKLQEMEDLRQTAEELNHLIAAIPYEIIEEYQKTNTHNKENAYSNEGK